jgi:hypothetical protein
MSSSATTDDDYQDEAPPPPFNPSPMKKQRISPRKQRKHHLLIEKKTRNINKWQTGKLMVNGKDKFKEGEEFEDAISAFEVQHCRRDTEGVNGLCLIRRLTFKQAGSKSEKQALPYRETADWDCAFARECGCPWSIRVHRVYQVDDKNERIFDGQCHVIDYIYMQETIYKHKNHMDSTRRTTLPLAYRQYLTSASETWPSILMPHTSIQ